MRAYGELTKCYSDYSVDSITLEHPEKGQFDIDFDDGDYYREDNGTGGFRLKSLSCTFELPEGVTENDYEFFKNCNLQSIQLYDRDEDNETELPQIKELKIQIGEKDIYFDCKNARVE